MIFLQWYISSATGFGVAFLFLYLTLDESPVRVRDIVFSLIAIALWPVTLVLMTDWMTNPLRRVCSYLGDRLSAIGDIVVWRRGS